MRFKFVTVSTISVMIDSFGSFVLSSTSDELPSLITMVNALVILRSMRLFFLCQGRMEGEGEGRRRKSRNKYSYAQYTLYTYGIHNYIYIYNCTYIRMHVWYAYAHAEIYEGQKFSMQCMRIWCRMNTCTVLLVARHMANP
ncbi:hypothetical protein VIN7_7501 [Saccharomyces cerevisiae x Saccharomyces kudriavzevii VIN7]|uniref:Uncharacterized protein n=1 Tax=Saccharomyces cerevisiae x Saccharomyces kudriavzevii (strain VIN7) TaxID=1095631 RepID=H0GVP1_SACCK|nr:hypothetical protein VIN7_7501 [Saccharomyces cerevisiae x Saccharomyces kudriavzevii VIN7]